MKAVSVAFSGSPNQYDYLCPFDVKVSDEVIVNTRRGEAKVLVMAVLDHSDKATASVVRVVKPDINTMF